ncbi:MAG: DUF4286 family protein [Paludibacter sp.]|nr:DUF4286 family protein [Paludibacter sp.]
MLIFNTTYKVETDSYAQWLKWVNTFHIPFMLESGEFSKPQLAKVIGSEDDGGSSFSLQFHIKDMDTLMNWHRNHVEDFQQKCAVEFGNKVIFFSTVLEIID